MGRLVSHRNLAGQRHNERVLTMLLDGFCRCRFMRRRWMQHALVALVLMLGLGPTAVAVAAKKPAKLIILGVTHGAELVDPAQNPGRYRAYFHAVKPDVLLIERDPRRAELGDWYPFTYEQQHIVVPYARAHGIPVVPFGWFPPAPDAIALGVPSASVPPPFRQRGGFQGLLTFKKADLSNGFFFAESPKYRQRLAKWAYHVKPTGQDFGRRLYLYRTEMMALHIKAVARQYPGKTLLVVVGWMHKPDLESLLSKPQGIGGGEVVIVPSNRYDPGSVAASYKRLTATDCSAIYSVNLLSGTVPAKWRNMSWLESIATRCRAKLPHDEFVFYSDLLQHAAGKVGKLELESRLRRLLPAVAAGVQFTWQAAGSKRRLDTVYDPFGRLGLHQRIALRLVRLDGSNSGNDFQPADKDKKIYRALLDSLDFTKRGQLLGYLSLVKANRRISVDDAQVHH